MRTSFIFDARRVALFAPSSKPNLFSFTTLNRRPNSTVFSATNSGVRRVFVARLVRPTENVRRDKKVETAQVERSPVDRVDKRGAGFAAANEKLIGA